jgi:hypothetical protein
VKSASPLAVSLLFLLGAGAATGLAAGATFHVSSAGADDRDGLSPETAWSTLDRVNGGPLRPGDRVLFRRGDAWRGQLRPWSGAEGAPVTYGAFGEGPKPRLLGSVARSDPAAWKDEGGGIWSTGGAGAEVREILGGEARAGRAWSLHQEGGAKVRGGRTQGSADSGAVYRIECSRPGGEAHHVQLYLSPISIERGKHYRLAFRARCTKPFALPAPVLMKAGPPWTAFASRAAKACDVGSAWTDCETRYLSTAAAEDGRLTLFLGGAIPQGAVLEIDAPSLAEIDGRRWLPADVGNIIFGREAGCGVKVFAEADLRRPGDFWYDEVRHLVKLRSDGNPAQRYGSIECALREHIVDQSGRGHVAYEDLALLYGGAHGIGGGETHHIAVRGCDLGFIGGGDQHGGGRRVRFGNGIEFWGSARDCLVERCRLWEIYDAALTNQSLGPRTPQTNIVYRRNVIWNCEYSFEYWNRPEESETRDILFEHNTCVAAGAGWGHGQRPDPSGRHLCFYSSPARARGISIRNNIFFEAKGSALYAPGWSRAEIDALVLDGNCWFQAEGVMMDLQGSPYRMADFARYRAERGKDLRSICAVPGLVDPSRLDFHLAAGSPCIDAGVDAGSPRDFDGAPVPQGKGPDIGAHERE